MLSALLLASAITQLFPTAESALVALIWAEPVLAAPVVLAAIGKARAGRKHRSTHDLVATWLRTVASELRAGQSLRLAVVGAVAAVPELELKRIGRLAESGRPLDEAASLLAIRDGFAAAGAALRVAARTGGSVVGVFDALTGEAVDEAALERERRTLTVQARLSVAIVGGFPLAILAFQIVSGDAARLLGEGSIGVAIVLLGTGLLVSGLGTVWLMLARARRAQ